MGKQDTTKNHAGDQPAIETDLGTDDTDANPIDAAMGLAKPQSIRSGDTRLNAQGSSRSGDTR